MDNINKNFSDIKDAFSILEGQDKLIHLIDLGKKIDKINIEDKKDTNKVHACTSQTWIKVKNDGTVNIKADSESAIVKGLLRILQIGFNNLEKKNIIDFIDDFNEPIEVFEWLNIGTSISSQRQNGFIGALAFIKKELTDE
jgi:cysteine desulfuration protein SufE